MLIEVLPKVHLDPALVAAVTVLDEDHLYIGLTTGYMINVSVDDGTAEDAAREVREKVNVELDWLKFEETPNAWEEEPAPC